MSCVKQFFDIQSASAGCTSMENFALLEAADLSILPHGVMPQNKIDQSQPS
jgi:hypothetical protein